MTDQISRRAAIGAGALLGAATIAPTRAQAQTAQPTAGDTLAKVKAAGTLLAGVRNDFPPIGSIDTSGKPVGFGPDLAEAFAKKLGVKAEFVPTTSRTRIPLLQNGSIDCEFGITTPTVERENTVDFSIPYVWDAVSIIIKEGASKSVKDYAPPKKVATTQGSYIIELFKDHIANPEIVLFQEYPDAVQALKKRQGRRRRRQPGKLGGLRAQGLWAGHVGEYGEGSLGHHGAAERFQLAQLAQPYASGALEGRDLQGALGEAHGRGARLLHVLPLHAATRHQVAGARTGAGNALVGDLGLSRSPAVGPSADHPDHPSHDGRRAAARHAGRLPQAVAELFRRAGRTDLRRDHPQHPERGQGILPLLRRRARRSAGRRARPLLAPEQLYLGRARRRLPLGSARAERGSLGLRAQSPADFSCTCCCRRWG